MLYFHDIIYIKFHLNIYIYDAKKKLLLLMPTTRIIRTKSKEESPSKKYHKSF